jgi:hypothetical protein
MLNGPKNNQAPTRRILRDLEWDSLPALYKGKVHYVDSQGQLQLVDTKSLRKEIQSGLKPGIKVMFNMLDYLTFSLAYCPVISGGILRSNVYYKNKNGSSQTSGSSSSSLHLPQSLMGALGHKSLTSQGTLNDKLFQQVLTELLEYLLPRAGPSEDKENLRGQQGTPSKQPSKASATPIESIYTIK